MKVNPYATPSAASLPQSNVPDVGTTRGQLVLIALGVALLVFAFCDFLTAEMFRQHVQSANPAELTVKELVLGPIRGIALACLGIMFIHGAIGGWTEANAPNDSVDLAE